MNKNFLKNPYYLVAGLFVVVSFLVFLLYIIFQYEKNIEKDMFTIATTDVLHITQNKADHITKILRYSDDYINDIKKDTQLQKRLEMQLKNLITPNIKYAYLLYKDRKNTFRFLVDGSEEKAMIDQKLDITSDKWFELYETKLPVIIKHTYLQKLSLSYLVPVLYKEEVKLVLVIDFSIDKLQKINEIIIMMKSGLFFILGIVFLLFIVFLIQFIRYKRMKQQSFTDRLTNVYNRNYLHEIEDTVNLDEYMIAALDIDYFKNVNDTYGHDVGDIILREVGNILLHTIRVEEDIVVRYGGEEFVIFIKNKSENSDTSLSVIQRVFSNIKEHKMFINEEDYIYITVSIGVNKTPSSSKNFLEAFKLADIALYEAKESGRDTIKIYGEN
ncbi:MAG: GGDEF domain-containing protein [Arcobacteraceae bacterium]|nr:GGDEF domain-containing protein [Arcobacteraceae bacterium]